MADAHQLLKQFIEEHRSGGKTDPRTYLERAEGRDRVILEALLDEYLQRAPRTDWDRETYEASELPVMVESLVQSLEGSSGLWPALLPRLRNRARITRADLSSQLASRLGADSKREKVAAYYHAMETGQLPARGVSDAVLEALGKIVGQSFEVLKEAGGAVSPGAAEPSDAAAFARTGVSTAVTKAGAESVGSGDLAPAKDWDEVDRLFREG